VKAYSQYDTHQLMLLVKQDDQLAFTELYNRFWQKLFGVAYNRLKEIQSAEDIVHDVFAGLWANRQKLQIESLENYLATSVKYMVLNKLKKKERQRKYNNSLHPTPVVDFPVETSLHFKRILERVKKEVEKLPEKCKLIFKYSRDEGKPVKQIAKELNLSPKTVENQLTKALKQIKSATKSFFFSIILL
jgi:RNA polymerase sigma-70 factor (ECF subfamily)